MGDNLNIISFFVIFAIEVGILFFIIKSFNSPSKNIQEKESEFKEILEKFNVPQKHCKIVISHSQKFAINDCPAIAWNCNNIVNILLLNDQPYIIKQEVSEFREIKFEVLLNHAKQNTDWTKQSTFIRGTFKPYKNDYKVGKGIKENALYKVGNFVLYPNSINGFLKIIDKPITDYVILYSYDLMFANQDRMNEIQNLFTNGAIDIEYYNQLKNAVIDYVIKNSDGDNNALYAILKSNLFTYNDIQNYLK